MKKSELKKWVRAWAAAYPAAYDQVLAPLAGRDHFDREAMEVVVVWKFQSMAHRRANARRGLAKEQDGRIEDITRRALSCNDDLGALLIVDVLQGVGPALGSAVLTAANPERYTVMDTRAILSVRARTRPPGCSLRQFRPPGMARLPDDVPIAARHHRREPAGGGPGSVQRPGDHGPPDLRGPTATRSGVVVRPVLSSYRQSAAGRRGLRARVPRL